MQIHAWEGKEVAQVCPTTTKVQHSDSPIYPCNLSLTHITHTPLDSRFVTVPFTKGSVITGINMNQ